MLPPISTPTPSKTDQTVLFPPRRHRLRTGYRAADRYRQRLPDCSPSSSGCWAKDAVYSSRQPAPATDAFRIDEVLPSMRSASPPFPLPAAQLVHLIDQVGDSVAHMRAWDEDGHLFVVRVEGRPTVRHAGVRKSVAEAAATVKPRGRPQWVPRHPLRKLDSSQCGRSGRGSSPRRSEGSPPPGSWFIGTEKVGYRMWDEDGCLEFETPMRGGVKHGNEYRFYPNGQLLEKDPYHNGRLQRPLPTQYLAMTAGPLPVVAEAVALCLRNNPLADPWREGTPGRTSTIAVDLPESGENQHQRASPASVAPAFR